MAFTVNDFNDLVQLLNTRPEWRDELRRLVLTDDILAFPAIVRDLAEAQRRTEARVEELAQQMKELAAAQTEMQRVQRQMLQQLGRLSDDIADVKGYILRNGAASTSSTC